MLDKTNVLEINIKHKFTDIKIIERALRRAAFSKEYKEKNPDKEEPEHQEVLCTLGDAVLKLILSEHLIQTGAQTADEITKRKQAIENRKQLAAIAEGLGVGDCLEMSNGEIKQEANKQYNVLGETLEAIIGAIYLDSHYEKTREVIKEWKGMKEILDSP